jgi:hypothetical protein
MQQYVKSSLSIEKATRNAFTLEKKRKFKISVIDSQTGFELVAWSATAKL